MSTHKIPYSNTGYFSKLICDYLDENENLSGFYGHFPNLEKLIAYQNQIKVIPATIRQCHNLTELWLGFNPIKDIPNEIGNLPQLRHLSLSNTPVTSIQWEEGLFKNLEELL